MSKIVDYLHQLDLSEIEAKLYLALLEAGPISVRDLALKIDLKRTTAYLYVDQLVDKGLVAKMVKGSHKLVAANDPEESLKELVKQKEEKAKYLQEDFPKVITDIRSTVHKSNDIDGFEIKYIKGLNGVKKIYEEALASEEVCSYINLVGEGNIFTDNVSLFDNAFKKNPKLIMREIIDDSPKARQETRQVIKKYGGYSCKFMPKDLKLTSEDILIFNRKVAILHFKGKASGVILQNEAYYNNSKELFEFLWKTLPEIK
jgi:sugar-specific transcriptional regulator TrmB